ncbi:TMEM175 family protein [Furfurilactobacillus entadae]|uniref:TMEM175 family protein n=1 Tax=Furfurilactobacillus entadae TaxID=2922307 RepID=UPI0035EC3F2F
MNKSRVEAFTDAVLAVILTIMLLEFKTPSSLKFSAIYHELPHLIVYAVGYLMIGVAWYNHHYMFGKTKRITKRIYWSNNFWLFTTSFIPVATAWVGEGINARGPELFYSLVYFLWFSSYIVLSHTIVNENDKYGYHKAATDIRATNVYRRATKWQTFFIVIGAMVLALIFCPAMQLLIIAIQIGMNGYDTPKDGDRFIE